jgi:hypothetical protein
VHFKDLSAYAYRKDPLSFGTLNVGWLAKRHRFSYGAPTQEFLDKLWKHCKISVNLSRGIHPCDFCAGSNCYCGERNGERLVLGAAEIRVFYPWSVPGFIVGGIQIYAAPTLIYHYIEAHHYKPPDEFVDAVLNGLAPSSPEYFDRLNRLGVQWSKTSAWEPRQPLSST